MAANDTFLDPSEGPVSGFTGPSTPLVRIDSERLTRTSDLAEALGLRTFDTALPMHWYDAVHEATGYWPQRTGFVYSYDAPHRSGWPFPISAASAYLMVALGERHDGFGRSRCLAAYDNQVRCEWPEHEGRHVNFTYEAPVMLVWD